MSERRSHWDDDLIVAVGDAIEHADPTVYPTVGMVNDVIAAVEDWQSCQAMINISASTYAMTVGRAEDAEAAIQRVREVPKKVAVARKCDVENPQKFAWYQGWNDAIDAVFRALDGDGDE